MRIVRPKSLTTRPRVSVVVPCYNYGRFLPDAVSSALMQAEVDVDVLIVDDASPDGSAEVAQELADTHRNVGLLRQTSNQGHLRTYNAGLEAVDGEYVVLLSADDQLAPGALGRSVALLEHHPSVGFAYGFPQTFESVPPPVESAAHTWSVWSGRRWTSRLCQRGGNVIFSPEVVMRRRIVEAVHGFDLHLPHSADMYMWLQAATIADVGHVNGPPHAFYRVHGENMHLNEYSGAFTDLRERLSTFRRLFETDPSDWARKRELIASRAIAREAIGVAVSAVDGGNYETTYLDQLSALAQEAWPPIVQSARWKVLATAKARGGRTSCTRAIQVERYVRREARYKYWRQFGV